MPDTEATGRVTIQILPFGSFRLSSKIGPEFEEEEVKPKAEVEAIEVLDGSTAYTLIVSLPQPVLSAARPLR